MYSPLSGSSYIKLPDKLSNSKKGLINMKNNDNKRFLWSHIRHLNPLKIHAERITKADKRMVNDLDYVDINFLSLERIIVRLNKNMTFALLYFVMKMIWFILLMY